jgi:hypothetical protein
VSSAEPANVEQPKHRLPALTTYELRDYRRQLEHAVAQLGQAPVVQDLRAKLDEVRAEFESRDQLAKTVRRRTGL